MLKGFLFTIILMVGCSLAAFGQTNDTGKPPPKDKPPVVPVKPKPTPTPTPPKRPNDELEVSLQAGSRTED